MEKNWERSAKVFGHRQVIDDGLVCPTRACSESVRNIKESTVHTLIFQMCQTVVLPVQQQS